MKKGIIYSLLLFLFACGPSDDETLRFLDEGIVSSNYYLTANTDKVAANLESLYMIYMKKTEKIKRKADSISVYTKRIEDLIFENADDLYMYNYEDADLLQSEEINLDKLIEAFSEFKEYLISCIENEKISEDIRNYLDNDMFDGKKMNRLNLNLILNLVYIAEFKAYAYLYKSIDQEKLQTNKYEPVVIPNSTRLRKGETYEADIFITVIDTVKELTVVINDDTLLSQNGKVLFKETANKPGKHLITGKLFIQKPGSTELDSFFFESDYKVLKK